MNKREKQRDISVTHRLSGELLCKYVLATQKPLIHIIEYCDIYPFFHGCLLMFKEAPNNNKIKKSKEKNINIFYNIKLKKALGYG